MSQKQKIEEIREQLKEELIENLSLEDVEPNDIKNDEILFGEDGLGLDSLDAVELVVPLQKKYNVQIEDMEDAKKPFASIAALAQYISEHQD